MQSLIVVLIVLVLDRMLVDRRPAPFSWFEDWIMSVEQRFNGGESRQGLAAVALTVGSVFLVTVLIQALLGQVSWLLRFGFDIACLFFLIQLHSRLVAAQEIADAISSDNPNGVKTGLAAFPATQDESAMDCSDSWTVTARLLAGMSHWLFAPVFWYLISGPAGAVMYFAATIVAHQWQTRSVRFQEFGRAANTLQQVLSWVPVRLLAIGYALLGDFEKALRSWKQQSDTWNGGNDQLLTGIGMGALGESEDNPFPGPELIERAVALQYRVIVFCITLLVLAGLIGLGSR